MLKRVLPFVPILVMLMFGACTGVPPEGIGPAGCRDFCGPDADRHHVDADRDSHAGPGHRCRSLTILNGGISRLPTH